LCDALLALSVILKLLLLRLLLLRLLLLLCVALVQIEEPFGILALEVSWLNLPGAVVAHSAMHIGKDRVLFFFATASLVVAAFVYLNPGHSRAAAPAQLDMFNAPAYAASYAVHTTIVMSVRQRF
jgi:hypothetical protein